MASPANSIWSCKEKPGLAQGARNQAAATSLSLATELTASVWLHCSLVPRSPEMVRNQKRAHGQQALLQSNVTAKRGATLRTSPKTQREKKPKTQELGGKEVRKFEDQSTTQTTKIPEKREEDEGGRRRKENCRGAPSWLSTRSQDGSVGAAGGKGLGRRRGARCSEPRAPGALGDGGSLTSSMWRKVPLKLGFTPRVRLSGYKLLGRRLP